MIFWSLQCRSRENFILSSSLLQGIREKSSGVPPPLHFPGVFVRNPWERLGPYRVGKRSNPQKGAKIRQKYPPEKGFLVYFWCIFALFCGGAVFLVCRAPGLSRGFAKGVAGTVSLPFFFVFFPFSSVFFRFFLVFFPFSSVFSLFFSVFFRFLPFFSVFFRFFPFHFQKKNGETPFARPLLRNADCRTAAPPKRSWERALQPNFSEGACGLPTLERSPRLRWTSMGNFLTGEALFHQRIAKGAGGKGPRQKTSKIVKKCQKVFRHFSTIFAQGKKTSKIVKKCQKVFRQFSRGTFFPAPFAIC